MIKDFNYYAPTRVVFGRESEEQLPQLIKSYGGCRVLMHYGGSSAQRSGLLDKVRAMLTGAGIYYVELGGVVPNPVLSMVYQGIDLCRRQHIDFILAIGGGSVIDSAKAIGYGVGYDGDVWDFWEGKAVPHACLPIGVMLTIPAAGSEMSSSCVITKDGENTSATDNRQPAELGGLKRGINSDLCRCRFCIMNPERTYTLPPYQTAAGCTDIMMHTMERYFSKYEDMTLTDAIAEALLRTVKECALQVMEHPHDYRLRAQIMWAGSLAHNDLTECGTEKDFATHRLEHELSALLGVTHGAGLAAVWGAWARYVLPHHVNRFVQFAVNVMGVPNDFAHPMQTARRGIEAVEDFYRRIGMPTSIPELIGRPVTDEEIALMVSKCSRGGKITVGTMEVLGTKQMDAIYRIANSRGHQLTGVILAAGMAKRLRPLTDSRPKCLLEVGGRTLLARTIDAMVRTGIDEIVIVTGYKADMIRNFIDQNYPELTVTYLHNDDYAHNNNIYSLWMAMQQVRGRDFLLMDSDILCDADAVVRIGTHPHTALAVNRHELGDEEMKVVVDDQGHITEISKTCSPAVAIGESVGIEKISADYSEALARELDTMIRQEGLIDIFYERAFERLIPQGYTFNVVDTSNYFSYELDTPEDFQHAQELIPVELL